MIEKSSDSLIDFDRQHIWHPYSAIGADQPLWRVESAEGVRLRLADGTELIDGMSSWWSAIHGYNHPHLNNALQEQIGKMSHVMFGGLTHEPAIKLAKLLVNITPPGIQTVFFSDSGSVAVEVSMKMAIQYWHDKGKSKKQRFLSLKNGYHGDTFGAMSVCDPHGGMHSMWRGFLPEHLFAPAPPQGYNRPFNKQDMTELDQLLEQHHQQIAGVILEPIVQGAGGMRIYSPTWLTALKK